MEQITLFRPAFDKRDPNPKKNYGIHCVDCFMVLKGERGAVHFTFSTGMFLKQNRQAMGSSHFFPMGIDVGYHSPTPMYEGQEVRWPTKIVTPRSKMPTDHNEQLKYLGKTTFKKIGKKPPNCEFLGVPCFCDGSALLADKYLDVLLTKGSDQIWKMLEEDYRHRFEKLV